MKRISQKLQLCKWCRYILNIIESLINESAQCWAMTHNSAWQGLWCTMCSTSAYLVCWVNTMQVQNNLHYSKHTSVVDIARSTVPVFTHSHQKLPPPYCFPHSCMSLIASQHFDGTDVQSWHHTQNHGMSFGMTLEDFMMFTSVLTLASTPLRGRKSLPTTCECASWPRSLSLSVGAFLFRWQARYTWLAAGWHRPCQAA